MHIKSKPKFISVSQMDPCRRACPFDLISVMYHIPTRFTNTTRWSLWRNTATNDPFPDPKLPFAWGNFRIYATSWYNPWQTRLYHHLLAALRLESGGAARSSQCDGDQISYGRTGLYNTLYSLCSCYYYKEWFCWKAMKDNQILKTSVYSRGTAVNCAKLSTTAKIKQQWLFVAHVI